MSDAGRIRRDCPLDDLREEFCRVRLTSLNGALPAELADAIARAARGEEGTVPIDVSAGAALRKRMSRPTLAQQFVAGGVVMYPKRAPSAIVRFAPPPPPPPPPRRSRARRHDPS